MLNYEMNKEQSEKWITEFENKNECMNGWITEMGKWEHDDVERAKKVDETQKHPRHTQIHTKWDKFGLLLSNNTDQTIGHRNQRALVVF